MKEIPTLMSEEEFQKELDDLRETMEVGNVRGLYRRMSYLTGWVSAETAPIFTPSQLSKIFDLAKE